MASVKPNNPHDVPLRVTTPELEWEEEKTWASTLLEWSSRRREKPSGVAVINPVPAPPAPTEDEVQTAMRQQAQMIDKILQDNDMQENYQRILNRQGDFEHLDFQPNITPEDELWRNTFDVFRAELSAKSVQQVLDDNFADWQKFLLLPPETAGSILDLQRKNSKKYKASLSTTFSSARDNILTKLTMVHFGLPVEPFTLNNILRAADNDNDPEDSPDEKARMQRIMYTEAPLEFLDGYDERSFGFPIIRRKTNLHLRGGGMDEPDTENSETDNDDEEIHLCGGAGKGRVPLLKQHFIYGPNTRYEVRSREDPDEFIKVAFRLLGKDETWGICDGDKNWEFYVDQYHNDDNGHENLNTSLVLTSTLNKDNYQRLWKDLLEARVFNKFGSWVVVVRHGGHAPKAYQPQLSGPLAQVPQLHQLSPSGTQEALFEKPNKTKKHTSMHCLYGYAGHLELLSNEQSNFLSAAMALLQLSDRERWKFTVDHLSELGNIIESVLVTKASFRTLFPSKIKSWLGIDPWRVFVRTGPVEPTSLEPGTDLKTIVQIHLRGRGTAYWKLPSEMHSRYAVNQVRDDFARAMKVLLPHASSAPLQRISIRSPSGKLCDLGFEGELTDDILGEVIRSLAEPTQVAALIFRIEVAQRYFKRLGIRMIGGDLDGHIIADPEVNPSDIYDQVMRIANQEYKSWPKAVSIWRTSEDRDSGKAPYLIPTESKDEGKEEIARALGPDLTLAGLRTTCICFRPEYSHNSTVVGIESGRIAKWNASTHTTLKEFRDVVEKISESPRLCPSFQLLVPRSSSPHQRRFGITDATTEEQWQRNVFHYIACVEKFQVSTENIDISYTIDKSTPWGVPEAVPKPKDRSMAIPIIKKKSTPLAFRDKSLVLPSCNFPSGPSPSPTYKDPLLAPTPSIDWGGLDEIGGTLPSKRAAAVLRFNKERIIKPRVSRPKPIKYDPWITEQNRLNRLKRESYLRDQSVIEPGQKPEIPIFGPAKELILSQGSSLPEIYCQRLTPTDIRSILDENKHLRNMVLERETSCHWCGETFPNISEDQKREHFKLHAAQLQEGGQFCPVCGTEDWMAMSTAERREHLFQDQDKRERETIKKFWENTYCPICDMDLSRKDPELILRHIASHTPEVLKFCERCGRNEQNFQEPSESDHHDRICTKSLKAHDNRLFCDICGEDRTNESHKQKRAHNKRCAKGGGKFCFKCSLDFTALTIGSSDEHIANCRPPSGPRRGFCTRCGEDRLSMTDLETQRHRQDCYMTDPRPRVDQKRLKDLETLYKKQMDLRARNRKDFVLLKQEREKLGADHGSQQPKKPKDYSCDLLLEDGTICSHHYTCKTIGFNHQALIHGQETPHRFNLNSFSPPSPPSTAKFLHTSAGPRNLKCPLQETGKTGSCGVGNILPVDMGTKTSFAAQHEHEPEPQTREETPTVSLHDLTTQRETIQREGTLETILNGINDYWTISDPNVTINEREVALDDAKISNKKFVNLNTNKQSNESSSTLSLARGRIETIENQSRPTVLAQEPENRARGAHESIVTTGFASSPDDAKFPYHRKRKAGSDITETSRTQTAGESAKKYNQRMKRQKTAPNVVQYAGEEEDESPGPRGSRSRRPVPTIRPSPPSELVSSPSPLKLRIRGNDEKEIKSTPSKVVKNKKHNLSGNREGEQESLMGKGGSGKMMGPCETPAKGTGTRRSTRTLSIALGANASVTTLGARRIEKARKEEVELDDVEEGLERKPKGPKRRK